MKPNTSLIIKYSDKHLNHSLLFGSLWLLISIVKFLFGNTDWIDYGFPTLAFLYLGTWFYGRSRHYLTIANGFIWVNKPFSKKINLKEVKQIKKFAGHYTLITEHKQLKIHTQAVHPDDLKTLDNILKNYGVFNVQLSG